MNVEIQRTAKPLDEGDDTGSGAAAGGQACPMSQIGLDGAHDDGQTTAECVGVTGEEQTQWPGPATSIETGVSRFVEWYRDYHRV